MLNKHQHGELYFGVKPDGTPIGQNVSEETLRNVSHRIAESIKPRIYPIVKKVVLDGKDCIYVKVEGNQIPYFAFGVAKMRVADEDITMSPEQITTVLNQLELTCDDKLLNAGKALLNSFCHKDYASGESNEVAIYKDRVEIYNPGAFPEGYDPQFFIEQPSRPIRRNPMIARTLYYSKDIESFGTGLKRIAEVCEEAGVRYEFQKLKNGFVVCFYRSSYRPKGSTGKVWVNTGKVRVSDMELNESQKRILRYVIEHTKITNRETCDLLNIKDSRAYKVLKEMNDKDILRKEGSYRDSYYRIAEDKNSYHV